MGVNLVEAAPHPALSQQVSNALLFLVAGILVTIHGTEARSLPLLIDVFLGLKNVLFYIAGL